MAANGCTGKILRVDLTTEIISEEYLQEEELKKWIGGTGIGAKYLYDEVPPSVQWNSPENRLIVASGPLGGTRVGGSGTISIVTKGTLTGGAVASQANGYMGAFMKFAGYDGVIFQGMANRWLYLYMHDGKAELRDAQYLLGKDTWETENAIKEELGYSEKQMSVFCIGPAGENLVKFAGIFGDKDHVAGHNGTGAVMGSKKLKAFCAARGKGTVAINDPDALKNSVKEIWEYIETVPAARRIYDWGTGGSYEAAEERVVAGTLPIRNYTTNIYPEARLMSAQYSRDNHECKPNPCWACRTHHLWLVTFKDGPYKGRTVEDPEYEMWASWGPLVGNVNPDAAMILANDTTLLGLEGNEAGFLISMLIELYEKGILTKDQTEGLELKWGNFEAMGTLLKRIAHREGIFANLLAEGTVRTVEALGPEAQRCGIYALKGHSPRDHDHRSNWREMFDTALSDIGTYQAGYLGAPDPDTHAIKDRFSPEDVSTHTALTKGRRQFEDMLGTCIFTTRVPLKMLLDAFNAVTGWDFTVEDARNAGYRSANIFRAFNLRHGLTVALERPSTRWASAPVDGPAQGITILPHWDSMMENYYKLMGWDIKTGKPYPETLNSLGLEYLVKDIWDEANIR